MPNSKNNNGADEFLCGAKCYCTTLRGTVYSWYGSRVIFEESPLKGKMRTFLIDDPSRECALAWMVNKFQEDSLSE